MINKRKKVLWLIKGLGLGGAEMLLVNALPYLNRDDFEYEIGYFLPWKDALVEDLRRHQLNVTCFGGRGRFGASALGVASVGVLSMWEVWRHLKRNQIDVLHAHLPWAGIIGRTAARLNTSWAATAAVLYTEHGCWDRLNRLTCWTNRVTMGLNDLTISVSDEVAASLRGVNRETVRTITNGIDCANLARTPTERLKVRRELGAGDDDFLIVKVANFSPVKRHEVLLEAFALFASRRAPEGQNNDGPLFAKGQGASLVLVGQYRDRKEHLQRLAKKLQIADKVFIIGPRTDVPRIVKAADVFAMSSASEGLPVSLLEAMALGKPVVCTRVGGIPGVVADNVEGLLTPAEQPQAMAEKFLALYQNSDLRHRLGEAGQKRVKAHFDISLMVKEVESEYRRILAHKSANGPTFARRKKVR